MSTSIRRLKISDPQGRMIPLEDLADIEMETGVYEIWRKDRQRRAMITVNVRGRDLAGFVAEAQRRVKEEVDLPPGYRLEWGGTFENLQSATNRLMLVVPVALALIFLLLFATFGSIKLGLLIFLSVPLGALGGVLALWLRGHELQHLGGRGLHRPLRCGGARRPGAGDGHPAAHRAGHAGARGGARGVDVAAAARS